MTSQHNDSLISQEPSLQPSDSLPARKRRTPEEREHVRLRCVAVFSSSPLYQAKAEKDPEYWNKFSVGGVR